MTAFCVFAAAREHPRRVAVVTDDAVLDYAALAVRTAQRAQALAAEGLLDRSRPLALVGQSGLASIEILLAAFAYDVPVLLIHPRLPEHEHAALARQVNAADIVVPSQWPSSTTATATPSLPPPPAIPPERPLVFVPTSGTTGQRKLAILSRRALAASAHASFANLPLGEVDRWLLCLPLAHVGGLSIVTRCLAARSAIVTFDPGPRGLLASLPALTGAVIRHRVTMLSLVPAVADAWLDGDARWLSRACLRAVLLGGAATSERLLDRTRAAGLPALPTYGLTEACSQVTTTPPGSVPAVVRGLASSGRPLPGVELGIEPDGRIRVRTPALFSGYVGGTAPVDDQGWLVTDDVGELTSGGELVVFGRASDRLVTGGENVDPLLVEATLRALPGVRAACAFGVADARFGDVVACALVAVEGSVLDLPRLQRTLAAHLAPHERPRLVAILRELPLNATGKVDRNETREIARQRLQRWEPAPPT